MLVITIVCGLLLFVGIVSALSAFERFAARKFNHRFFTVGAFGAAAAALGCIVGGHSWWQAVLEQGGDPLNGLVLMAIGVIIVIGMLIQNLRRAGLLVGLCGSVLQASVFGVIGSFGLVVLGVGLALSFVGVLALSAGATPVYVVNRW